MLRKRLMGSWYLVLVVLVGSLCQASELKVGSSEVKGTTLRPAQATWYIATRPSADAEWARQGTITEKIKHAREGGHEVLLREQITHNEKSGVRTVDTVVVDSKNLRPLRWNFERKADNLPPEAPLKGSVTYDGKKVEGQFYTAGGKSIPVETEGAVEMFDAGILGLLLATLPLKQGYEDEIPALFQGRQKYMIRARVTARKNFKAKSAAGNCCHPKAGMGEFPHRKPFQAGVWFRDQPLPSGSVFGKTVGIIVLVEGQESH